MEDGCNDDQPWEDGLLIDCGVAIVRTVGLNSRQEEIAGQIEAEGERCHIRRIVE